MKKFFDFLKKIRNYLVVNPIYYSLLLFVLEQQDYNKVYCSGWFVILQNDIAISKDVDALKWTFVERSQ